MFLKDKNVNEDKVNRENTPIVRQNLNPEVYEDDKNMA